MFGSHGPTIPPARRAVFCRIPGASFSRYSGADCWNTCTVRSDSSFVEQMCPCSLHMLWFMLLTSTQVCTSYLQGLHRHSCRGSNTKRTLLKVQTTVYREISSSRTVLKQAQSMRPQRLTRSQPPTKGTNCFNSWAGVAQAWESTKMVSSATTACRVCGTAFAQVGHAAR